MGLKTDESSIHVLPPDEGKHKSTTAKVESNLLDTNPDTYVKRAEYFVRKGMLTEAENEYDVAILFSLKANKYIDKKFRFYKDVLHNEEKAKPLLNRSTWKSFWWFAVVPGANLIAFSLDYRNVNWFIFFIGLFLTVTGVLDLIGKLVGGVFGLKSGISSLFSKKQPISDAELDAMGDIEPTPLEEAERYYRKASARRLFGLAVLIGIIFLFVYFVVNS